MYDEGVSYFIHPKASCDTQSIGDGTRVWGFTRIMHGVTIGSNCNICDFVFIEDGVTIGNNVTIKSGVYLWRFVTIEDNVFIGPNATFTNDKYPKSGVRENANMATTLKKGCSIGANATILPGLTIGEEATVGAGSVVTRNVDSFATVWGNPARVNRSARI